MRTTLLLAALSFAPVALTAQSTPPRQTDADAYTRYELLAPGSGKFRLKTDQSGYKNLFFAGDWIDTGYNMGCAEVAIMSGLMAAQALRKKEYGLSGHKPIIKDLNLSND